MENMFGAEILKGVSKKKESKRISLFFYEEDMEMWEKIKEYNIFDLRKRECSNATILAEGLALLREKYGELTQRDDRPLGRKGRKNKDYKLLSTTAFISLDDFEYYQNFMFHQIYEKRNLHYHSYDFWREIVELLMKEYKLKR